MKRRDEGEQAPPGLYHPAYTKRPSVCGGCGAGFQLPKGIKDDGHELRWMLAGRWRIDAEAMTIRCPECVATEERAHRVLAAEAPHSKT